MRKGRGVRIEATGGGRGVDGDALRDRALSFRAKGLLAYLYALPRGEPCDVARLEEASTEGRSAIETAIRELVERGYARWLAPEDPSTGEAERAARPTAVMENLFGELLEPVGTMEARGGAGARRAARRREEDAERTGRIIDHLNWLRERSWEWAQYTPLSARYARNVEHIRGRLRDGFCEEDLILVLDYLAAVDGGKEESRRYFNCVTPFNTKNFERNLGLARDWSARGRPGRRPEAAGTSRGKDYYLRAREEDV